MRLSVTMKSPAHTGFSVFGPLFLYFTDWLCKTASRQKIDKLYFLSREGFFLKDLYDHYTAKETVRKKYPSLPVSEYYLCSRRSFLGAVPKNEKSMKEIISYMYFDGTIQDLLKIRIGYDAYRPKFSKKISLPDDLEKTIRIIKPYLAEMDEMAAEERHKLFRYTEESGFLDCRNPGVVDVGYSATVQRLMYSIFQKPLKGFYWITRDSVKNWQQKDNMTDACFGSFQEKESIIPVYYYSLIFESFLISPAGQLINFSEKNGKITPNFGPGSRAHKHWDVIEQIISGIKEYFDIITSLDLENSGLDKSNSQELFRSTVVNSLWDREIRKLFFVEDHFCGTSEFDILRHLASISPCPLEWNDK